MGFKTNSQDRVDAVAFVPASSAERALDYLEPDKLHEWVTLYETQREAEQCTYEESIYEVTISIRKVA